MSDPLTDLGDFMMKKILKIPKYQRNYAWSDSQLKDLWNDLVFLKKNKRHFFGTILLKDLKNPVQVGGMETYNVYEIIDGQQRITSISILLNEIFIIMDNYTDIDNAEIEEQRKRYLKYDNTYLLELLNEDEKFYKEYIIDNNSYPEELLTPSLRRLRRAKRFFRSKIIGKKEELDSLPFKQFLNKLVLKIKALQIIKYIVKEDSDAILIFQTVNDRGVDLSRLEKTKSFLMHMSYLSSPKKYKDQIDKLNYIFSVIYRYIEEIKESEYSRKIDEEQIQRYHYIIYNDNDKGNKKKATNYFERLKEQYIECYQNNDKSLINKIQNYARDLKKAFSAINEILSYKKDNQIYNLLRKIQILERIANFYPLLISMWINNINSDPENIVTLLKIIEIFSFRVYAIGKRRSDTGESKLYRYAYKYYNGKMSEKDIYKKMRNTIEDYENDTSFERNIYNPQFYNQISRRDIIYFFYEYEMNLRKKFSEPLEIELKSLFKTSKFHIDHIFPKDPKKFIDIKEKKDSSFDIDSFKRKHKDEVNKLGNLVVASGRKNEGWKNKLFREKRKDYSESSLRIQKKLSKNSKWELSDIDTRTKELNDFAQKRWRITKKRIKKIF